MLYEREYPYIALNAVSMQYTTCRPMLVLSGKRDAIARKSSCASQGVPAVVLLIFLLIVLRRPSYLHKYAQVDTARSYDEELCA